MQLMNTNISEKRRVIVVWNRCQPYQQTMFGKDWRTWWLPSYEVWQFTTWSRVYIMGRNRTVTKRGTTFAMKINGNVNLNLFLEKE